MFIRIKSLQKPKKKKNNTKAVKGEPQTPSPRKKKQEEEQEVWKWYKYKSLLRLLNFCRIHGREIDPKYKWEYWATIFWKGTYIDYSILID